MSVETIEQTFSVRAPARLILKNYRGQVDIQPGDEQAISITAVKYLDTGNDSITRVDLSQASDGSVSAITRYEEGIWGFLTLLHPSRVDYTVRVPAACHLEVSCVDCQVTIQGAAGSHTISTVNGDLNLRSLSGELDLSAVSGRVYAENLSGLLRVKSVSGDVRLSGSQFPSLNGKTVSGDLFIQTPLGAGPYNFSSVSGDVYLDVQPGAGCSVHTSSISGRLYTRMQVLREQVAHGRRSVQVGAGGPAIDYHSISGDFHLESSGAAPAAPEDWQSAAPQAAPDEATAPAQAGLSPAERLGILDRIASGELTVEQGLEALQGETA